MILQHLRRHPCLARILTTIREMHRNPAKHPPTRMHRLMVTCRELLASAPPLARDRAKPERNHPPRDNQARKAPRPRSTHHNPPPTNAHRRRPKGKAPPLRRPPSLATHQPKTGRAPVSAAIFRVNRAPLLARRVVVLAPVHRPARTLPRPPPQGAPRVGPRPKLAKTSRAPTPRPMALRQAMHHLSPMLQSNSPHRASRKRSACSAGRSC